MTLRIAVVGGGISGNLAARLLSEDHHVEVFEAASHLGGHAQTIDVELEGQRYPVDVGFMVYNERTYPTFTRMLRWLGVASRETDMSLSVRSARTGLEYQGSSLNGIFAQRQNLLRPRFYRMLSDILRFNRRGREWARILSSSHRSETQSLPLTVGQFVEQQRFGKWFVEHYLTPMAAAIWSCPPGKLLDFPLPFLLQFFENHGLMQLRNRPQWRTIVGGSRSYVTPLMAPLKDHIRRDCPVRRIQRHGEGVRVETTSGAVESYHAVILATHADQSLRLLADASQQEREILSAFPYEPNEALLHTDVTILPRRRRAWASWNYHLPIDPNAPATVTYDLSRLQGLRSPKPILLTLNASSEIDESQVLRRFHFQHPAYGPRSIEAQQQWPRISGLGGVHYCGAYWGYGFHEDGVKSAVAVASQFRKGAEPCRVASTAERFSIIDSRP